MSKYVFAYDTHGLNEERFGNDDVRKIIIDFLLSHGVLADDIKEPVQTTFTFISTLETAIWNGYITNELVPAFNVMMQDVYYYFGSIKQHTNGNYFNYIKGNPVLQRNLNGLIQQAVRERGNR